MNKRTLLPAAALLIAVTAVLFLRDSRQELSRTRNPDGTWTVVIGQGRLLGLFGIEIVFAREDTSGQLSEFTPSAGAKATSTKHTFSLNLGRPELYRITWAEAGSTAITAQGAAWSAGDGHKAMIAGKMGSYPNRETAWAVAGVIPFDRNSSLIVPVKDETLFVKHKQPPRDLDSVPRLFFKDEANGLLRSLQKPSLLPDETVGEEACYVVAADQRAGKLTLWITKKDLLLKKMQIKAGPDSRPNTTPEVEELSDESLKKMLKLLGQDPTPEAINQLKTQRAEARKRAASAPPSTATSTTTSIYQNIATNELMIKDDFEFSSSGMPAAPAKTSAASSDRPDPAAWTILFDGKDLGRWKVIEDP